MSVSLVPSIPEATDAVARSHAQLAEARRRQNVAFDVYEEAVRMVRQSEIALDDALDQMHKAVAQ